MISILFLSANPDKTTKLALQEECNAIADRIQTAHFRDAFKLEQRHAISLSRIQGYLLQFKPNIVHFSGHGSDTGKLVFEGAGGAAEEASPKALANLFGIINNDEQTPKEDKIRLVVLNACYTEAQADAISKHVDCVIGIADEVKDISATTFSESFYQALGYGRSVDSAFKLGCNQIGLTNDPDEKILKLKVRVGINPARIILARTTKIPNMVDSSEDSAVTPKKVNVKKVLGQMERWKEMAKKPYQIEVLCKGKERVLKLPVIFGRDSKSYMLVAKDGTNEIVDIARDALASRISDDRPGHAMIFAKGPRLAIKDLGSKNGTLVEDKHLLNGDSTLIDVGDRITVGNTVFYVKEVVSEIKHIAASKSLWTSFRVTYVNLLDHLVEEDELGHFVEKLQEFKKQFEKDLDPVVAREIENYIDESKSWFGAIPMIEIRNKWKNKIRKLILES